MKRLREVFTLTVPEQRVIIFVLAVLVGVIAIKTYRERNAAASQVINSAPAQPSPSPGIRP